MASGILPFRGESQERVSGETIAVLREVLPWLHEGHEPELVSPYSHRWPGVDICYAWFLAGGGMKIEWHFQWVGLELIVDGDLLLLHGHGGFSEPDGYKLDERWGGYWSEDRTDLAETLDSWDEIIRRWDG